MNFIKPNCYILTGAPGTGKSVILSELSLHYKTFTEPAREIIAEQRSHDGEGLWEKDRELFIRLMIERSLSYYENSSEQQITFFDRGIPDCVGYADYGNVETKDFITTAEKFRYNQKVFVFEPWKDIYQNDEERTMSFEEAKNFHQKIVNAYKNLNYDLVIVPRESVQKRLEFILSYVI